MYVNVCRHHTVCICTYTCVPYVYTFVRICVHGRVAHTYVCVFMYMPVHRYVLVGSITQICTLVYLCMYKHVYMCLGCIPRCIGTQSPSPWERQRGIRRHRSVCPYENWSPFTPAFPLPGARGFHRAGDRPVDTMCGWISYPVSRSPASG